MPEPPAGETKIPVIGDYSSMVVSPILVNGEEPEPIEPSSTGLAFVYINPTDTLGASSKHYWRGYDENGDLIDNYSSTQLPIYTPSEGVVMILTGAA